MDDHEGKRMLMEQHHHSLSVSRWEKLLEYELERTHPQLYSPTVSLHPDPWCELQHHVRV